MPLRQAATIEKQEFLNIWRTISQDSSFMITLAFPTPAWVQAKLELHGIRFVFLGRDRQHWAQRYVNLAAKTINGHSLLIKIALKPSSPQANVRVRSEAPQLYGPLQAFLQKTLQ